MKRIFKIVVVLITWKLPLYCSGTISVSRTFVSTERLEIQFIRRRAATLRISLLSHFYLSSLVRNSNILLSLSFYIGFVNFVVLEEQILCIFSTESQMYLVLFSFREYVDTVAALLMFGYCFLIVILDLISR